MTTELAEKFFECADEHSVFVQGGNKPGATPEVLRWRKRYLPGLSLAAFLLIGVPAIVLLFWGASWMDKLPQPVPWWQGLLWLVVLFTLFWGSFVILLESWTFYREYDIRGFGQWILWQDQIIQRYGMESDKTLPYSEIQAVKLNKQQSQVFLETDGEPMVMTVKRNGGRKDTPFLPFLNRLIDHLEVQEIDLGPLYGLQDELRKKDFLLRTCDLWDVLWALCVIPINLAVPVACMLAVSGIDTAFLQHDNILPLTRLYILIGLGIFVIMTTTPIGLKIGNAANRYYERKQDEQYRTILKSAMEQKLERSET